jgi:Methyltransferase FkbM domain
VTFYLQSNNILGGSVMGGGTQSQRHTAVRVPGRTLTELGGRYGPLSALVMDIEGAELEALESAGDILKKYRVTIIEFHEEAIGAEKVERCREVLRGAGLPLKQRAGAVEAWQRD